MNISSFRTLAITAVGLVAIATTLVAQNRDRLSEDDLTFLIENVSAARVVQKIEEVGLGFEVNDAVLQQLEDAGAGAAILDAVRAAGQSRPAPEQLLDYESVNRMFRLLGEEDVLDKLNESPTNFILDEQQERELRGLGASDRLIEVLQDMRLRSGDHTGDVTNIAIILDCSGSMQEHTSDGEQKMEVAKQLVTELVESVPNGLNLTFLIYGHNQRLECQAVEVVRPLSVIDDEGKAELTEFISRLRPVYATPIALALNRAGSELDGAEGKCALVLISDGKETCRGNPVGEAERLLSDLDLQFGVNFGVRVVGFDVDDEGREQLHAVAEATGGEYHDASNAEELTSVIEDLSGELIVNTVNQPEQRRHRELDIPVNVGEAGAFFSDAGPITAGEEYSGMLETMTAHYYRIPVREGQEVRAIVTNMQKTQYDGSDNDVQTFSVTIYDDSLTAVARESVDVEDDVTTPASLRATWTAPEDGIAYVAVAASDSKRTNVARFGVLAPKPTPYTLKVRRTPETGDPPRVAEPRRLATEAGSGFNRAGELTLPGIAAADIKLDEVLVYRFPATRGEHVQISVGAQKPYWGGVANWFSGTSNQARYTVTLYDDDQIQTQQAQFVINGNQPDAGSLSVTWPMELSGSAYLTITCENSGNAIYPADFDPKPGRLAVQIRDASAFAGAEAGTR